MLRHYKTISLALVTALIISFFPYTARTVSAAPQCEVGDAAGGAKYQICQPETGWNGDLILYAHGYVPIDAPLALPAEAGRFAGALQDLGYAFATTSYRVNGLAVLPALDDLVELVEIYRAQHGAPRRIFLIGGSEGGLITTLAVERRPDLFAGGLAMCGPVGSFRDQINYFGDFRVLFDAYFPGRISAEPMNIPPELASDWPNLYRQQIVPLVSDTGSREQLAQVFEAAGAAYEPANPSTMENTLRGVLGYNIFATNDASQKLGGRPFSNESRNYKGSADDKWLNQTVRRYAPDPAAQPALDAHETTGKIDAPLVTLHTTGDEIVPYRHADRYQEKVRSAGRESLYEHVRIERYGHCTFTGEEVLDAFARLARMADAPRPSLTPTTAPTQTPTAMAAPYRTEQPTRQSGSQTAETHGFLAQLWQQLLKSLRGLVQ